MINVNNLKIIFMGTPEFGAIILEKMINTGYIPMAVVTNPDKPTGRKQTLTPSPVKLLANKNKIQVFQSENIRNLTLKIRNLQPDLVVLAAFGQIIPKEILEIPKHGCLNVHPSLLPKYRGASPIQTAILNDDKETGVTIMLMDEKLDHGSIIAQQKLKISKNKFQNTDDKITYQVLHDKLAKEAAELLIKIIPKWVEGKIKAQAQDHSKATYTKIIKKEDGRINWQKSAQEIERQIRALNPWPGTFTIIKAQNSKFKVQGQELKLKILKAKVIKTKSKKTPGTVFLTEKKEIAIPGISTEITDKSLAITCGQDAIILENIQPESKRPMKAKDFLNGYPWIIGSILD